MLTFNSRKFEVIFLETNKDFCCKLQSSVASTEEKKDIYMPIIAASHYMKDTDQRKRGKLYLVF